MWGCKFTCFSAATGFQSEKCLIIQKCAHAIIAHEVIWVHGIKKKEKQKNTCDNRGQ